jgi:ABC-type branched-subunit amino acid transport system ATPase component
MGGKLSYGQQKIVELARMLLANSSLIFLDEPLAGLAPGMRQIAMLAIQKMASNGSAVVIVEHDFPSVKAIAQRGYVLDEGNIFMTGTMQEIGESDLFHNLYIGI